MKRRGTAGTAKRGEGSKKGESGRWRGREEEREMEQEERGRKGVERKKMKGNEEESR